MEYSTEVDASLDEVFAWHARPGAIHRLLPPWQPFRVQTEATSLVDGEAVLRLPLGIPWRATHVPADYRAQARFVDKLTTPVLRWLVPWRHEHDFVALSDDATQVTDRITTRVPDRLLTQNLAYRSRQLAGDFAAHAWAAELRAAPLTVAVSGSSGLIGTALCAFLSTGGHRVVRLVRGEARTADERHWDTAHPDPDLLTGVDAVIHLAGESIAGRFTADHKRAILQSRVTPTRGLAELMGTRPFVVASAVGIYGPDRGDEELTESSERGDGVLADVVAAWEAAADPARDSGSRVTHVRTGIVQSPAGGVLAMLRPLFALGAGGRLGSGRQWMPWIGIDDMVDIYLRCAIDDRLRGPVNAVAPQPVRNADYTKVLARVLRRPAIVPVPAVGPKLLFGSEATEEFVLAGQRVRATELSRVGHRFRFAELEPALRHLLGRIPADR